MKFLTHLISIALLSCLAFNGWAQDAAAAVSNATPSSVEDVVQGLSQPASAKDIEPPRFNLQDVVEQGGLLIYLLVAMSVLGVSLIVYFFFSLNVGRIVPPQLMSDILIMVRHNRYDEARKRCERSGSPAAIIAMSAIDYMEVAEDPDQELLREIIEGEGMRQATRMQTQINYLLDIGVIAPMVGLLGTVMGMLKAFNVIAYDVTKAAPVELASGVSQALVTTAAGLFVAIPAMLFYATFRGRVARLTAALELAATELVTTLLHRKTK